MLTEDLKALLKKSELTGCSVSVWALTQDTEFQELFNALRNRPNLNLTEALAILNGYFPDLPFKRTSFVHHMKGTCTCPKA